MGYLYQGTTDAPARVTGCTSKVNITYTGTNTSASIGGLVGYCNTNKISNTVIENCVNHGTIKAENGGTVGGIIGSMSSRTMVTSQPRQMLVEYSEATMNTIHRILDARSFHATMQERSQDRQIQAVLQVFSRVIRQMTQAWRSQTATAQEL